MEIWFGDEMRRRES